MTPHEPLTTPGVRAIVQRHLTDEETVSFEGVYASDEAARQAVTDQLALCRAHMIAQNEEVHLVHRKKSEELNTAILAKGEELKRLESALAELKRTGKRAGLSPAELDLIVNGSGS